MCNSNSIDPSITLGGGVALIIFVKLYFEIAVDQQTRARDQTLRGSGLRVPAGQPSHVARIVSQRGQNISQRGHAFSLLTLRPALCGRRFAQTTSIALHPLSVCLKIVVNKHVFMQS